MTALPLPPRLRSADLCRLYGIGPSTELKWRRQGKISYCKVGAVVWYPLECVVEFEVRRMVKARPVRGLTELDYDRLRATLRAVLREVAGGGVAEPVLNGPEV